MLAFFALVAFPFAFALRSLASLMRLTLAFFVLAFPFAFALCSLASPIRFYARSFCDCCFSVCVRIAFARFATFAFALAFLALVAFSVCVHIVFARLAHSLLRSHFLLSMLFRLRSRCVRSFRPFAFTLAFFVFVAFPFALASCSLASLRSLLRSHFCFVAFPFAIALRSLVSLSLYALSLLSVCVRIVFARFAAFAFALAFLLSLLFGLRSHCVRSLRSFAFTVAFFAFRLRSHRFARFAAFAFTLAFFCSRCFYVCARIVFARFATFAFTVPFAFALFSPVDILYICMVHSYIVHV